MKHPQLLPTWKTEPHHLKEQLREKDSRRPWLGYICGVSSTSQKVFWTLIFVGALFNIRVILDHRINDFTTCFSSVHFKEYWLMLFIQPLFTQTSTPHSNGPVPVPAVGSKASYEEHENYEKISGGFFTFARVPSQAKSMSVQSLLAMVAKKPMCKFIFSYPTLTQTLHLPCRKSKRCKRKAALPSGERTHVKRT